MATRHLTETPDKAKMSRISRGLKPDSAQLLQSSHPVTQLQSTLGNQQIARLIQAKRLSPSGEIAGIQRKLTVGAANDQYEQEADQVARQVMSMPDVAASNSMQRITTPEEDQDKLQTKPLVASITPFVQRDMVNNEEDQEKPIQAKSSALTDSFEAGDEVESRINQSKGSGSVLPDSIRSFMQPRFGVDFGHVRVHTDSNATQMNRDVGAQAFTHGSDIYFGEGRGPNNLELTAHELTHVVQQSDNASRKMNHKQDLDGKIIQNSQSILKKSDITNTVLREEGQGNVGVESVGAALARTNLERTRGELTACTFRLGAYSEMGNSVINKARGKMERFSERYSTAHENYSRIMHAGREEARSQQQWIDIFAGIAIGAGAGLLSGAIVGEATLSAAARVAVEVATEAAEAGATAASKGIGLIPQVVGQDLEPGGLHPELINSRMWQTIALMYRNIMSAQRISWDLPLQLGNTEYALGQLSLLRAGAEADMNENELVEMAQSLARSNRAFRALNGELEGKIIRMNQVSTRLDTAPDYPTRTIEQDIFIVWISSLSQDQSDVLDIDAIEDHLHNLGVLGNGGRLRVNFGVWTSEADELEAISSAHTQAGNIRARFESMTSDGDN